MRQLIEKRVDWIFLAIIALAGILRFYQLGFESLWWDELFAWNMAKSSFAEIIEVTITEENNPPLYYLLLHIWSGFLGFSDLVLRSLSALASVITVFYVYLVGSEFNKSVGRTAALLSTVSWIQIWFAQEVRMYALFSLFSVMSIYYLIRLRDEENRLIMYGYILSTAAMLYTHSYAAFVFAAQIGYVVWLRNYRSLPKRLISSPVYSFAIFLPWTKFLVDRAKIIVEHGFWLPEPRVEFVLTTFIEYTSRIELLPLYIGLVVLSIPQLSLGNLTNKVSKKDRSNLMLLWLCLSITIATPILISVVLEPIYLYKYTISASIVFYLLASYGISRISSKSLQFIVILLVMVFSLHSLSFNYYDSLNKEKWRSNVNTIDSEAANNAFVLYSGYWASHGLRRYSDNENIILKPIPREGRSITSKTINDLDSYSYNASEVWLFLYNPKGKTDLLVKKLNETYSSAQKLNHSNPNLGQKEYSNVELYRFH
jgi:mannosyltransferase